MILVTALLPERLVEMLDELVAMGLYPSRSDAIRQAVRDLLRREWELVKSTRRRVPWEE